MKKQWRLGLCPKCGSMSLYRSRIDRIDKLDFSCYPKKHRFEKPRMVTVIEKPKKAKGRI